MTQETNWIEFEVWMDDVSIQGYMAEDEADDEAPLNFYRWDGFEGGSNITVTRCPSFTERQMINWETLVDWFTTTDVVQWLVVLGDNLLSLVGVGLVLGHLQHLLANFLAVEIVLEELLSEAVVVGLVLGEADAEENIEHITLHLAATLLFQ